MGSEVVTGERKGEVAAEVRGLEENPDLLYFSFSFCSSESCLGLPKEEG